MKHLVTLAAALLVSGTLVTATTAHAQAGGYYQAVPAVQAKKGNFITRSTTWRMQNGAFVAMRAPERDMVLCQLVTRQTGALASFTAGGKAYDPAALEECNTKAKPAAAQVASAAK